MVPDAVEPTAAAQEAWSLIAELNAEMRPRMLRVAAELGLSPPQLFALKTLDPDEPMPMSALAQSLHCDNSNVTGLVDGLAARGLVQRRESEHDRRIRMLVVTDRGAGVRARFAEAMHQLPDSLTTLSAADQQVLCDVLRRALGRSG